MVSKNNSQKRVNRKNKLTRRRVSISSSKKRTNKRSNSTSSSSNKSKKRHSKKKSKKGKNNKTSKKRKSRNSKNTKANNVLMKGGSKLYHYIFFGEIIQSTIGETVETKLDELIGLFTDGTIALPLTPEQINFLKNLYDNDDYKYLFGIPILKVLDYENSYTLTDETKRHNLTNNKNILTQLEKDFIVITKEHKEKIITRMTKIAYYASSLSRDESVSNFINAFKARIEDNLHNVVLKLKKISSTQDPTNKKVFNFMVHFIMKDFNAETTKELKIFTFAKILSEMYKGSFENGISCFPLFGNPDILLFYLLTCSDLENYFRQLMNLVRFIILGETPGSVQPKVSLPFLLKEDFDRISGFDYIYTNLDFPSNLKILNHFKINISRERTASDSDSGISDIN